METLVGLTEAEVRALPQVTISEIMLATCNPWTFDPVLGTLDALIGSGKLGVLRHAPLRESLTTFGNLVADAAGDVEFLEADATEVWRGEVGLGGPWTDPETEIGMAGLSVMSPDFIPRASAEDLLRAREDEHFMGLVSRCHINAGYYLTELERLRAQILVVQSRIEESR